MRFLTTFVLRTLLVHHREILTSLSKFNANSIRKTIEVSDPYATLIRGERMPHPRHSLSLAI
jgi:hypothetical protein